MKYVLGFWALPMGLFWGWYFLSLNDVNFGLLIFSRQMHDMFFEIYGNILGIDPQTIPALAARACVVDTLLLMAIWAFRRRRSLIAWARAAWGRYRGEAASPSA